MLFNTIFVKVKKFQLYIITVESDRESLLS